MTQNRPKPRDPKWVGKGPHYMWTTQRFQYTCTIFLTFVRKNWGPRVPLPQMGHKEILGQSLQNPHFVSSMKDAYSTTINIET